MRTSTALRCTSGPGPRFAIHLDEDGADRVHLVVVGDVDVATEDLFAWALEVATAGASSAVVVNLTGVDFFSLSAVGILNRARATAARRGISLEVRARPGIVSRALRLVGWPGVVGSAAV